MILKNDKEKVKTIIKMYNENYTYKKIAEAIEYSENRVFRFVTKELIPNKTLKPRLKMSLFNRQREKIIDMYNNGYTYLEIAKIIRCKVSAMRDYIYRRIILQNLVTPRGKKYKRKKQKKEI